MRFGEVLRSMDWILVGAAVLLSLLGLAMLFSATYAQGGWLSSRFTRQVAALVIGFSLMVGIGRLPYHAWRRYAAVLYGVGLLGLVVVYLSAQIIRGTASRLTVAGVQLQPSEFMKIALLLVLATFFARGMHLQVKTLAISLALLVLPVALIVLEPDLGVAALLVAVWLSLLFYLGLSWRVVAVFAAAGGVTLAGAWQWWFASYQRNRILVFLDPARDPLGAGYNVVQSIVALGSGQWFGRGLGHGPQSQLKFLPEQHTDFILASIGEELGFIGVLVVIALYAVLLWRILVVARSTRDRFGHVLTVGSFLLLLISFFVSAGMNMGLLPVTGIPLPLVSYGGSSLVSTFVLLGLVQSVRVYSKWVQAPPPEISHFT